MNAATPDGATSLHAMIMSVKGGDAGQRLPLPGGAALADRRPRTPARRSMSGCTTRALSGRFHRRGRPRDDPGVRVRRRLVDAHSAPAAQRDRYDRDAGRARPAVAHVELGWPADYVRRADRAGRLMLRAERTTCGTDWRRGRTPGRACSTTCCCPTKVLMIFVYTWVDAESRAGHLFAVVGDNDERLAFQRGGRGCRSATATSTTGPWTACGLRHTDLLRTRVARLSRARRVVRPMVQAGGSAGRRGVPARHVHRHARGVRLRAQRGRLPGVHSGQPVRAVRAT